MADDEDIFEMLEAPFKNDHGGITNGKTSPLLENGKKERSNGTQKSSRHRSRSRDRSKREKIDRDRGDDDKVKERDRDRDKREKDRRRGKDGTERVKDREKHVEELKEHGHGRERDRYKERDRKERDPKERDPKERERHERKEHIRPREKERERDHPPEKMRKEHEKEKERENIERPHREREREQVRNEKKRSGSIEKRRRRSMSPRPFRRGRTPPNSLGYRDDSPVEDLSPEERDARTIFCMQLSQRIRARDLEEFFSSVGKVKDVRLITCNKTKRFKGIAYIEFKDPESVALALGLSGQRLLGIPISVQHTQAEKNRLANATPPAPPKNISGPMRLYVGSLHFNITEDMLRGIFEPFGKIDSIQLIMDTETGRSKGYGFITFHNADDAKKALEQLNGFELAGRPMKVGNVTERLDVTTHASLDTDEMDRSGIDLGATGRLQLMFKLAEGAGLAVPQAAANALLASAPQPPPQPQISSPPIATQCFLLSNMFDPVTETNSSWDIEIKDDVIEECNKHGGVLHVYVDTASTEGHVYVKCPSIATAVLAVNALHGRWFAGRVITAAYVPLINYHTLFPDAHTAQNLLQPTRKP